MYKPNTDSPTEVFSSPASLRAVQDTAMLPDCQFRVDAHRRDGQPALWRESVLFTRETSLHSLFVAHTGPVCTVDEETRKTWQLSMRSQELTLTSCGMCTIWPQNLRAQTTCTRVSSLSVDAESFSCFWDRFACAVEVEDGNSASCAVSVQVYVRTEKRSTCRELADAV